MVRPGPWLRDAFVCLVLTMVSCREDEIVMLGETGEAAGNKQAGDQCSGNVQCIPGTVCFNGFCVGEGKLRVSLAFNVDSDFDLHVLTPTGDEIYFLNPVVPGAELDVDQCVKACGNATHVENVVFRGDPPPGDYEVWVLNYQARDLGRFSIEVAGLVDASFGGSLPQQDFAESEQFQFTVGARHAAPGQH